MTLAQVDIDNYKNKDLTKLDQKDVLTNDLDISRRLANQYIFSRGASKTRRTVLTKKDSFVLNERFVEMLMTSTLCVCVCVCN